MHQSIYTRPEILIKLTSNQCLTGFWLAKERIREDYTRKSQTGHVSNDYVLYFHRLESLVALMDRLQSTNISEYREVLQEGVAAMQFIVKTFMNNSFSLELDVDDNSEDTIQL